LFMLAILAVLIYYRSVFNEPVRPPQETAIQA